MKFKNIFKFAVMSLIILFPLKVSASSFVVDPDYTNVSFRLKHLMGYVVGHIKKYDGKITLDAADAKLTGLEASLDMTSIDTKNQDRDEDLKSERFFDTAKFPQASFKVKSVTEKKMTVDLTLKGVTKEVTLDYEFLGTAKDQYGRLKAGLRVSGSINRKDFGITYNTKTDDGAFLLGDEVDLKADIQGILEKQ